MSVFTGLLIIVLAGFFQGSFMVPMSMQKKWAWENGWMLFSLLGMIVLNWIIAAIFIPGLVDVYLSYPAAKLLLLCLIGLGWGCGAVLFGIGMEKLGLSLGYPIIQGLTAMCGALIPMFLLMPGEILSLKGILLVFGSAVVILGIIFCSGAGAAKDAANQAGNEKKSGKNGGIMIAVAAGILSSFPNLGASVGSDICEMVAASGVSEFMAGNAVWPLFFTFGFIPNAVYTIYLYVKNGTFGKFRLCAGKNMFLGFMMSLMWIGSFYFYGIGANMMGLWGLVVGWPLYISFSIVMGNVWGLWRGEWKGAAHESRKKLNIGMAVIIAGMAMIGVCNFF